MKILVITQFYWPEPFKIHNICENLVDRGHQVTVVTGFPNYPEGQIYEQYRDLSKRQEIVNGVNVIRCKARPRKKGIVNLAWSYLSYAYKGVKSVSKLKHQFDAILVYQMSPIFMAIPAIYFKRKNKIPLYVYCLDLWPESVKEFIKNEKSILYRIIKGVSVSIYNRADMVGITSKPFRQYLIDVCRVENNKIVYLPQYAEGDFSVESVQTEENGYIDFVFMGNVGISQDLDKVVYAVKQMDPCLPFKVHIVGSGSNWEQIKKLVDDLNLSEKIILHGRYPLSEMPSFYRLADACLLTLSANSAIGLTIPGKLQGYMSAGKPIIAAANGASREIIKEADCGICVPAGDVKKLAEALTDFTINHSKYQNCAINSRKYFEIHFTKKIVMDQLEDQMNEMLKMWRKNNHEDTHD